MKNTLKHIVGRTYKPLLVKYLSKTRVYKYGDIKLEIAPQVFHPGFFFSTKVLLNYIKQLPLQGKSFLEPGCGSGLISIYAAKKGATVTATDINSIAIKFLKQNAEENNVSLEIIGSDLFQNITPQSFDIIAINPPFYKQEPITEKDYAWYCGENGEYFSALFEGLHNYIHPASEVLMVLFDEIDMQMINDSALKNGFRLRCVHTHKNLLENNSIYKIESIK